MPKIDLAGGLTEFGVNLMRLPAGGWSSQRHSRPFDLF
jgi:uncharacterized cupin superfamily protein